MATVTGTVKFTSDEAATIGITFEPADTPQALSTTVVLAQDTRIVTSSAGAFSQTLLEGRYLTKFDNGEEFYIDVPSGSGSHDITTLIDVDDDDGDVTPPLYGVVNPEGVVTATPGRTYLNTANDSFWVKRTGSGNTGWMQLLG